MSIPPPVRLPDPQDRYDRRTAEVLHGRLTHWFKKLWEGDHVVNGKLTTKSGRSLNVVLVTAATYTIKLTDDVVDVRRTGAVTLTLPENPANGQRCIVQDSSGAASANPITINQSSEFDVNGGASVTITADYGRLTIVYNGEQFLAA